MSKCYWKKWCLRLTWYRVATNLQFVKNALICKTQKAKCNKRRPAHKSLKIWWELTTFFLSWLSWNPTVSEEPLTQTLYVFMLRLFHFHRKETSSLWSTFSFLCSVFLFIDSSFLWKWAYHPDSLKLFLPLSPLTLYFGSLPWRQTLSLQR